jgi:hypothetical protein
MANRPAQSGITLSCAISLGQDADRGILLVVSDCCRLGYSTAQRLRAKSLSHPYSQRFADA